MAGRRRGNPNRRGSVPAGWAVVSVVVVCLAASAWLVVELIGSDDSPTRSSASTSATPSTATPTVPTTPTPEPSESTASPTPDEPARDVPVSVLNNTTIRNLASSFSTQVTDAGWTVAGIGNWRGQIIANTVYYPQGWEEQGRQLAKDVGIERVLPSIDPMRTDRLTIILSGPQP